MLVLHACVDLLLCRLLPVLRRGEWPTRPCAQAHPDAGSGISFDVLGDAKAFSKEKIIFQHLDYWTLILLNSNGFLTVLVYSYHSSHLLDPKVRSNHASNNRRASRNLHESQDKAQDLRDAGSFHVRFASPTTSVTLLSSGLSGGETENDVEDIEEFLVAATPSSFDSWQSTQSLEDPPPRFHGRLVLGDREDFIARRLRNANQRNLLSSRTVAEVYPRSGIEGTVAMLRMELQKGFRRKVLAVLFLQLLLVEALMAAFESSEYRPPGWLAAIAAVLAMVVYGVLALVRHQVPSNFICLLAFTGLISFVLAWVDGDISNTSCCWTFCLLLQPGIRLITIVVVSVLVMLSLSQTECRGRLFDLRLASLIGGMLAAGVSFGIDCWGDSLHGDPEVGWGVHAIALALVLWIGWDAHRLVMRLDPNEYLMAAVYFYADLVVLISVMAFLFMCLPVICTDGSEAILAFCNFLCEWLATMRIVPPAAGRRRRAAQP